MPSALCEQDWPGRLELPPVPSTLSRLEAAPDWPSDWQLDLLEALSAAVQYIDEGVQLRELACTSCTTLLRPDRMEEGVHPDDASGYDSDGDGGFGGSRMHEPSVRQVLQNYRPVVNCLDGLAALDLSASHTSDRVRDEIVRWAPDLRSRSFALAGSECSSNDEPAGQARRHQIACDSLTELRFSYAVGSRGPDWKQLLHIDLACAEELQLCEVTLKGPPVLGDEISFSLVREDDARVVLLPGEVSAGEGKDSAGGEGHDRCLRFRIEGEEMPPGTTPPKCITAAIQWVKCECSNDTLAGDSAIAGRWQMLPQSTTDA